VPLQLVNLLSIISAVLLCTLLQRAPSRRTPGVMTSSRGRLTAVPLQLVNLPPIISAVLLCTLLQRAPSRRTPGVMTWQARQAGQQRTSRTGCGPAGTYLQSGLTVSVECHLHVYACLVDSRYKPAAASLQDDWECVCGCVLKCACVVLCRLLCYALGC
jgi:hypothetical protein